MKEKIIFFAVMFCGISSYAGVIRHSLTSTIEEKVMGRTFKSVVYSGSEAEKKYYIDGFSLPFEKYELEYDRSKKDEIAHERQYQEKKQREKILFFDKVQLQVTAKLLNSTISEIQTQLQRLENPQLQHYFLFTDVTVVSQEQLSQIKRFVDQSLLSMKEFVESNDFDSINLLYAKCQHWPDRLEKFFQESIQHAIHQSDDTAMLKEILTLIAD